MLTNSESSCSARRTHRGLPSATTLLLAIFVVSAPLIQGQVQVLNGAGLGGYGAQVIPTGRVVQLVSQPQVFSAEQPAGIVAANPYAAVLAAAQQAQQVQQAQQDAYGDSRSFAESQAASLLASQQPEVQQAEMADEVLAGPSIQVVQQERPAMAVRLVAQPQVSHAMPYEVIGEDSPTPESVLADEQASAELASKLFQGISNITSTLAQRYSEAATQKANLTTAARAQAGNAVADLPDAVAEERKAIQQVTASNLPPDSLRAAASDDSALTSQQPSLTVVKVQQSAVDPNVRHVQVVTLQKKTAKTGATAWPLARQPEDARLETAAAPAGAVQSAAAPVQAPSAQPSLEPAAPIKVFQQEKAGKSFQQRAKETLARLATAPASEVEVITAPDVAPTDDAKMAPADGLHSIQINRKYGGDTFGAQIADAAAAPAQPREAGARAAAGTGSVTMRQLAEAAATHPAVIWQSHLLDITPTQWPSYKARSLHLRQGFFHASYISGIAQGANVAESQVAIVGVTSASTVTVNTQITYPNDDTTAAKSLTDSLKDAQGAPIYIPNFGQVQVSGVTQLDAPAVSQYTGSSQVSWTGTSAAALSPATPTAYAPALQPGASIGTTQQSLSTLQQQQTPTAVDAVPQIRRQDKVYSTGGLPTWAAITVAVGVIVVVALLLLAARHQRKRTERLTKSLLSDSATEACPKTRTNTDDSEMA